MSRSSGTAESPSNSEPPRASIVTVPAPAETRVTVMSAVTLR